MAHTTREADIWKQRILKEQLTQNQQQRHIYDPDLFQSTYLESVEAQLGPEKTHMTSPYFQPGNAYRKSFNFYEVGASDPNRVGNRELKPHFRDNFNPGSCTDKSGSIFSMKSRQYLTAGNY